MSTSKPTIALASDHAGFPIKEAVKRYLEEEDFEYIDFGTDSSDSVDYPDFVHPAVQAVVSRKCGRAILVCGSGQGTQMTANRYSGVRATLCWKPEIASLARRHNDSNVLSLPGRFVSPEEAIEIVRVWLSADFEGGRHSRRIKKIETSNRNYS